MATCCCNSCLGSHPATGMVDMGREIDVLEETHASGAESVGAPSPTGPTCSATGGNRCPPARRFPEEPACMLVDRFVATGKVFLVPPCIP